MQTVQVIIQRIKHYQNNVQKQLQKYYWQTLMANCQNLDIAPKVTVTSAVPKTNTPTPNFINVAA